MKIVIIGNGPAGTTAAKKIRQLNKDVEIIIISFEKYPYYARPQLPELIEGKIDENQIQIYNNGWYKKNNINLNLNTKVLHIDKKNKKIITEKNEVFYDKLLLATGSSPFLPPINGINNTNIFTLRTIDDAQIIKNAIQNVKDVICIGGGLLGLELANVLVSDKRSIKIIEYAKSLLNKQIDEKKAIKLQKILEKRGFVFYLCETCKKIKKENNKLNLITNSRKIIQGDMVIISAGASARINLAKEIGLESNKGIIVNEYLQTSDQDIYAAGDCIEFNGKIWGFVKSSIEQGNIAGANIILKNKIEYTGTDIDIKLKVTDIDLNLL